MPYSFSPFDLENINKLVEEKYSKYEWNIGRSPIGSHRFDGKFDFGILTLTFDLKNGKMENVEIFGDFFCKQPIDEFVKKLYGIEFQKEKLFNVFNVVGEYINGANGEIIANKIFE